ncbi:hypothetical protein LTS17_004698 [Exophiala oligosperma]
MSEYLPSFIVEPVLRQARRFSRLSTAEEPPSSGFLPAVPDFQRWNPSRLWTTSPPPSLEEPEPENKETTVQSITRTIQLWVNQLNAFDDQIPSPPLEPMDDHLARTVSSHDTAIAEFPRLDTEPESSSRPVLGEEHRTSSDRSLNPAQELSYRSRAHQDSARPHSMSDPLAVVHVGSFDETEDIDARREAYQENERRRRNGSGTLPEDDGMGVLRQKINAVRNGPGTQAEKSRLVHALMMERHLTIQALRSPILASSKARDISRSPGSPVSITSGVSHDVVYNVTAEDLIPTYAPLDPEPVQDEMNLGGEPPEPPTPDLGCVHYKRNVKMQCNTCQKWYPCRLCHDEVEDHTLPRRETKHMLYSGVMIRTSPSIIVMTVAYAELAKVWGKTSSIAERVGLAESVHKCIERSTKCDCPICGEYMFTSNKSVVFMRCGHSIHEDCFAEWCNASYKCPICSKSIANMESQFRRLDRHIEEQPMPEEYRDNRAYIFCNDCNSRSVTRYHWLGLKCSLCESYNTTQLELLGAEHTPQLEREQERAQQAGISEAAITASQSHTPTGELTQPATTRPADGTPPRPIDTALNTRSPGSRTSWLSPHSPTARSVRSQSPVIGSYFGTGQRTMEPAEPPRRGATPLEDDDDLDFWGRPNSPRQHEEIEVVSESESESSSDNAMDDDEDEEEDAMDLIGHR